MNSVEGPWRWKDWFLNFHCPRCGVISRYLPARGEKGTMLVLCVGCRSPYSVTGYSQLGFAFGVIFTFALGLSAVALYPAVLSTIPPWAFLLLAMVAALALIVVIKPALARRLLTYEYVGHAT